MQDSLLDESCNCSIRRLEGDTVPFRQIANSSERKTNQVLGYLNGEPAKASLTGPVHQLLSECEQMVDARSLSLRLLSNSSGQQPDPGVEARVTARWWLWSRAR